MRSILRAFFDLVVDIVRIIVRIFASPPPPPRGYGDYDTDVWRWDPRRKRWVLRDSESERKGYNCTEYCIARIEGRAPLWGGDEDETTETEEIEDKLKELGWHRGDGECNCGTGEGQTRDCVVVYACHDVVVHAAILDKVHGDWGGKASAAGPIERYRRPEDYFNESGEVPADCEMRFYCPPEPIPGEQKTDEWLHENAREQA